MPPAQPWHIRLYSGVLRRLHLLLGVAVFFVYDRKLSPGLEIPPEILERYRFAELTGDELLAWAEDPALELPPEKVRAAVERGDLFFGVFFGSELVAYRWYSPEGPTPCENGWQFVFAAPGRVYGYRTFTRPDHRGRRLPLYAVRHSDTVLAERGFTHGVGYISARNIPSLKAYGRVSHVVRVGTIVTVTLKGRMTSIRSPGAARHGLDMVPEGR